MFLNVVSGKIGKILLLLKGSAESFNLQPFEDYDAFSFTRELIEAYKINRQGSEFIFKS